jgi:hypothetical protein
VASSALADTNQLTPFANLKEEYTDNVFFSSDNVTEDWITTLTGGVTYRFEDERTRAGGTIRLDALRYAHATELNDIDQSYSADVSRQQTERLTWRASAAYIRDSTPGRDIDVTGLILNTDIRHRQHYSAGADYQFTEVTSGHVSYDFQQDRFDDPRNSDVTAHSLSLSLERDMNRWWNNVSGFLTLGATRYDYDTANIDSYSLTIGARKYLYELMSLDVSAGGRFTRSDFDLFGESSDDWGGVGRLSLRYWREKLSCNVSIVHDVQADSSRTGVTERTSLVTQFSYRFLERMTGSLTAGIYLNKADAGSLSRTGVDETTFIVRPSLQWRLLDTLRIGVSYVYENLKDHETDRDVRRNAVFVSVRWGWDVLGT